MICLQAEKEEQAALEVKQPKEDYVAPTAENWSTEAPAVGAAPEVTDVSSVGAG